MSTPDFSLLPAAHDPAHPRHWLMSAIGLLAISGIAPLILIAGRGSFLADTALVKEMFHSALVVHVDLSVLAWFLAIAGLFWALATSHASCALPFRRTSVITYAMGGLMIALSPLLTHGTPLMSNYIPVFTSPLFFFGLGLMLAGTTLALLAFFGTPKPDAPCSLAREATFASTLIVGIAIACFVMSYLRVTATAPLSGTQDEYEALFWAGGHVLQLAFTQLLLVAWLWLAQSVGLTFRSSPKLLRLALWITPLVSFGSFAAFMDESVPYNMYFFTQQMRHGGGLGALLIGGMLLTALLRHGKPTREQSLSWSCLVVSLVVFAAGGTIGYMIGESNTVIPAHYHGSIVGTTAAFMGIVYLLLPQLGAKAVKISRWSLAQPWLYGGGSLLHVVGFAIAGGHGAARKTVGAVADGSTLDLALHVMRLGGLLAVIGGGLFVVLAIRALWPQKKTA